MIHIDIEKKLHDTINHSKHCCASFNFPSEVPSSPNALKLYKWYRDEVKTINCEIDKIESQCSISCTCGKGCSFCCKQLIVVSEPELIILQQALQNLPKEQRQEIYLQCQEQCKLLEQNDITPQSYSNALTNSEKQKALQDNYFKLNLPCPFLSTINECIVYPVRPIVCWSYRNYDSNSYCKNSPFTSTAIKYTDWEITELIRLHKSRRKKSEHDQILQYAIVSTFNK